MNFDRRGVGVEQGRVGVDKIAHKLNRQGCEETYTNMVEHFEYVSVAKCSPRGPDAHMFTQLYGPYCGYDRTGIADLPSRYPIAFCSPKDLRLRSELNASLSGSRSYPLLGETLHDLSAHFTDPKDSTRRSVFEREAECPPGAEARCEITDMGNWMPGCWSRKEVEDTYKCKRSLGFRNEGARFQRNKDNGQIVLPLRLLPYKGNKVSPALVKTYPDFASVEAKDQKQQSWEVLKQDPWNKRWRTCQCFLPSSVDYEAVVDVVVGSFNGDVPAILAEKLEQMVNEQWSAEDIFRFWTERLGGPEDSSTLSLRLRSALKLSE